MDSLLGALRAAGERTRLRLLALLAHNELTVSELSRILGQSQPRVSRHLKLLGEAGLLDRFQEGAWVFYRLTERGPAAATAQAVVALIPHDDPELARDRLRLDAVKQARAASAGAYFARIAASWDEIRRLYVPESTVEAAMIDACGDAGIGTLLDLGTGTGRILEVFGERIERGIGIDLSQEMLAVARAHLDAKGLAHCRVRRGDVYNVDLPAGAVDAVTIHHVLHFLDRPGDAIAEAARVLRPRGRLLVVDFAPHDVETLRTDHAHRRLGFSDDEVRGWCDAAGLGDFEARHIAGSDTASGTRRTLTVSLWTARQSADSPAHYQLEVA